MVFDRNESFPQFMDRFLKWIAFAVLFLSVSYMAAAASHFWEGDVREVLAVIRKIFGVGAALIVLPSFIKMLWFRLQAGSNCAGEPEGFISDVYKKSTVMAFSITFVAVVLAEPLTAQIMRDLPPTFYLQAVLACMTAVLGACFFLYAHEGDQPDDGYDDVILSGEEDA